MIQTTQMQKQALELCSALIRAASVSGDERNAVQVLEKAFETLGFHTTKVDRYGSIVGCIRGKRPGKKVLLDGHIDTVPVRADQWRHDPYGAAIDGGRLYGRGASDMKGALAAMVCGAAGYARSCGYDFPGEIHVSGVVFEELFEGVAAREVSASVQPDYVVIGEASELNVKIGQRGRAEVVVEVKGKPAHSANPEQGVNAVKKMCALLTAMENLPCATHPVLGKGILEVTDIISDPYPGASVVPQMCTATLDRRLLPGEDAQGVLRPINELIAQMASEDADFRAQTYIREASALCYTGQDIGSHRFFPAWLYQASDSFVQAVVKGLREIGQAPELSHYSFCTNGSHYAGERGIRTLGYGPSTERLAHTIDEYIQLEQLYAAVLGYESIIGSLLGLGA